MSKWKAKATTTTSICLKRNGCLAFPSTNQRGVPVTSLFLSVFPPTAFVLATHFAELFNLVLPKLEQ
ncbi:hypothetical protein VIBNIWn13_260037 [Vibrio nigripulchritudo Wn13]|nr:hypothetical protein VIBNIBLFn1_610024 [Vibrio nigripulchritudo BLFn1]CCN95181.1 hypothetical protein VIBNIENn2_490038 [Vibrio nigripulchritudo ENn2]CCO42301.1 hypothetical protein VIBNISFn135_800037 [Vibrio nigripulchritudo SFn135]CCO52196.1 hypothetical protein VIBNIWn13_260037 [Vibrio nigripulchritudo Wn13]